MTSVCVFCGSAAGDLPEFADAARACGAALAREKLRLVYGGGSVGLMGVLANAALAAGVEVVGVIPRSLSEREVGHGGLTALRIVQTMHERKAVMADLSDAFLALPGGVGTLDEFFETWTWAMLGYHRKPFGLLNVAGYYDNLLQFMDDAVARGFLTPTFRAMVLVDTDVSRLLGRIRAAHPPVVAKYLERGDV